MDNRARDVLLSFLRNGLLGAFWNQDTKATILLSRKCQTSFFSVSDHDFRCLGHFSITLRTSSCYFPRFKMLSKFCTRLGNESLCDLVFSIKFFHSFVHFILLLLKNLLWHLAQWKTQIRERFSKKTDSKLCKKSIQKCDFVREWKFINKSFG